MTHGEGYDANTTVPAVVESLLRLTLPDALQSFTKHFAAEALRSNPYIAQHAASLWGDLSEGEGNVVAREVGVIARAAWQWMVVHRGGAQLH
jgi:hypothetical protein